MITEHDTLTTIEHPSGVVKVVVHYPAGGGECVTVRPDGTVLVEQLSIEELSLLYKGY